MRRTIMYGVDEGGHYYSRVGDGVLVQVLNYAEMTPENNYEATYTLVKCNIFDLGASGLDRIKWTRKIPTGIKNKHRKAWDMPALDDRLEQAQELAQKGLFADEVATKQWCLEQIITICGGDIENIRDHARLMGFEWETEEPQQTQ